MSFLFFFLLNNNGKNEFLYSSVSFTFRMSWSKQRNAFTYLFIYLHPTICLILGGERGGETERHIDQ